jgi:hypothetical protein
MDNIEYSHPFSFNSSDALNFELCCDLEESEVIYDDPLDIDDIEALHPMVIVMSRSHVINSQWESVGQDDISHYEESTLPISCFVHIQN